MALVLVVADDLTGANATAAGFARSGFRVATTSTAAGVDDLRTMAAVYDVVVASTDSRHLPADTERRMMREAVQAAWPVELVVNRVDTTLRGNIGASTEALIDEVAALTGGRVAALFAPAHPDAGRQTIEGHQFLDGRRLEDTEVARDPRTPVHTSDVAAIVAEQAPDLVLRVVPLSVVTGPAAELAERITGDLDTGSDVLVCDATTTEHLRAAADSAVIAGRSRMAEEPMTWVGVDPGPGAVELARALGLRGRSNGKPLLVVSGSATELTRTQLAELAADPRVRVLHAAGVDDGPVPDVPVVVEALTAALKEAPAGQVVVVATVLQESDLRSVDEPEAAAIPAELARAAAEAMRRTGVDGLMTTGGDVTAAMVAELGAGGLEVTDEVVPLAVVGTLLGGEQAGLPVVTKGGLVGVRETAVECVEHLRRIAGARRRHLDEVAGRRNNRAD